MAEDLVDILEKYPFDWVNIALLGSIISLKLNKKKETLINNRSSNQIMDDEFNKYLKLIKTYILKIDEILLYLMSIGESNIKLIKAQQTTLKLNQIITEIQKNNSPDIKLKIMILSYSIKILKIFTNKI